MEFLMGLYTCSRCGCLFEDSYSPEHPVVKCSECGAHFDLDPDADASGDPLEYHDNTGLRYLPEYPH